MIIDVCLVSMPYAAVERPAIALGLLKASLQANGIVTQAIYPNLWFAAEIGLAKYQALSLSRPELLMGEWTFSQAAFPELQTDIGEYLREIAYNHPAMRQALLWLRDRTTAFVDRVAQSVIELNPRIVSCSSTFQQNCASLALLRRIRELNPAIATIMGGANCEGEMGMTIHQSFDWVDYVCSGEGDEVLARLCQQILTHGRDIPPQNLPYGVIAPCHRQTPMIAEAAPRASVADLDRIAIPDYDEYFHTLKNSPLAAYIQPGIPLETSRGCWWGQKQHCTFCGLNGAGITYRSKSPERVVQEFTTLSQRYGVQRFFVVDNILDLKHIDTVMPIFAALEQPYTIFYETKANLRKEQLQQLAQAGVQFIQPGIENMHDRALQLLKKGNIALMNAQLLKWCRELGMVVDWNFLIGIPGESGEWYSEMVSWLPLIVHLQPPSAAYPIRYDRFSPYQQHPENYGLQLSPHKSYSYVYPFTSAEIAQIAYYFQDCQQQNQAISSDWRETGLIPEHRALQECITTWGELFWSPQPPQLTIIRDDGQQLQIIDTRPCAVESEISLTGLAYSIYLASDRVLSAPELLRILKVDYGMNLTWDQILPIVEELRAKKIFLQLNNRFLSLATKAPLAPLPNSKDYPGGHVDVRNYIQDHRQKSASPPQGQSSLNLFTSKV